jgi:bacterioferritin-associated ferredoxin
MIDRCVCFDLTFDRLKQVAENHDCKSIDELQTVVRFGHQCRLCHPYVEKMLRTGRTSFRVGETL